MNAPPESVACLVLPVGPYAWLIPSAAVAEILPWPELGAAPADWQPVAGYCLGTLSWHGVVIPVVDVAATGDDAVAGRCIALLNRVDPAGQHPFVGVSLHGLPRSVTLDGSEIAQVHDALGVLEQARVVIGSETFAIPDPGPLFAARKSLPAD